MNFRLTAEVERSLYFFGIRVWSEQNRSPRLAVFQVILKIGFRIGMHESLTRLAATLSPSDGEGDGVRGFSEIHFGKKYNFGDAAFMPLAIQKQIAG